MNAKRKNTQKTYVLLITIFILLLFLLVLMIILEDKVTMNPPGTIGNTAGNLNNSGLFCEYDGKVYFSNSYDNGTLYTMTPDEGEVKKIASADACNILAGGDYLYYFRTGTSSETGIAHIRLPRAFNRCKLDGSDTVNLTRDTVVSAQLVDNYLYILTGDDAQPSFYKMKIDKSDKTVLADYIINPACAENGVIYYNGTESDHYLYALDTTTDVPTAVWKGNLWNPVVEGDYVYYMDVANNYRLCRYSFSQDIIEVLTNDRVDCFNVGNGYIYYQANSNTPSLNCMNLDGSDVRLVAEGNYTNINMTSKYVYFQEYGNVTSMYHSYLGSSGYDVFQAAREAAIK